jgi:hypothetical protein
VSNLAAVRALPEADFAGFPTALEKLVQTLVQMYRMA